ncbi:MAG: family 2 glycosyl transferase, partial [Pseudomonadota bacterium]
VLREFGYDTDFPRCQDYDLHVRLAQHHRMANLPQLLVCGREHEGRITKNTRGLGRDRKMAIQAKVLAQLGVEHSEQDLLWHYLLTQKADPDVPNSREYLDWAEAWLQDLAAANRRVNRFETAAFRRVLGAMWAVASWHYSGGADNRLPARLLGSSLSLGIPGNLDPVTWSRMLRQPKRPPELDLTVPGQ